MPEKTIERKFLVCPKGHNVPYERWNYARDFLDNDVDAMTLQQMYEVGLFCIECDKAYGLSKLTEPKYQ